MKVEVAPGRNSASTGVGPHAHVASAPSVDDPSEPDLAFQSLPPDVQELVREGRRSDERRERELELARRSATKRARIEGLLLVAPIVWIQHGFAWGYLAVGMVLGLVVGSAWARLRTGQVATPLIAAGSFLTLECLVHRGFGGWLFGALCGGACLAFAGSYLGLRREMRITE